ncbi:HAMP domain-containing histidine kinase [Phragmitibacter flavus]|uniref:histidine kinase n=1 Tax=Phragmitibacter flavus TaxID=2576071 RepID=A0A5R8KAN3_9BACT|nr:HAMP domain-containing sensor histidine kinase [Phragmitibacter flavus]TLD69327.1 HAMP domain-containing histidine kinase [Phragmitibacter flavus]
MSLANPHLILVHGDGVAADALSAAAGVAFAQWQFSSVGSLEEAVGQRPSPAELLVMVDPGDEEWRAAREVALADGLPRWNVVALSHGAGVALHPEMIPQAEWHPATLARYLRHALTELDLRRRCLRHEGDMHTIARRIRHDLNAPLNGILSMTELIQDIASSGGTEVAELTPSIFEAIDRMVALIDRVSAVAKASSMPHERESVPMEEPLWAALQKMEFQMLKCQAKVESTEGLPGVHGSRDWLQMIWQTLISNALKHGGKPPLVRIGWGDGGDGWKFWVEDNGGGVREGSRDGLFKPFHLLHQENRAYGLGLSLVQRLVDLQGGYCGFEELESGSRFFFVLPKDLLANTKTN